MKNNMDYFKTMNEKDLDLTKTALTGRIKPLEATVTAQQLQEQRVKLVKLYCAMAKTRRFLKVSI